MCLFATRKVVGAARLLRYLSNMTHDNVDKLRSCSPHNSRDVDCRARVTPSTPFMRSPVLLFQERFQALTGGGAVALGGRSTGFGGESTPC